MATFGFDVPVVSGAPKPMSISWADFKPSVDARSQSIYDALIDYSCIRLTDCGTLTAEQAAALGSEIFQRAQTFDTGEHPSVSENGDVYRPVAFDSNQTLLWHHENSFNAVFPAYIMFVCRQPAQTGGETTLVDSRAVYEALPKTLVARFEEDGVRYTRRCVPRLGRSWQELYQTEDMAEAERAAALNHESLTFLSGKGEAEISAVRPASLATSYGQSWVNQLLHWHDYALPEPLRTMTRKNLVPAMRSITYGDGAKIPDSVVERVWKAHKELEFAVKWETGQVLLINNSVFAHGRRPYTGDREHFVQMFDSVKHVIQPGIPQTERGSSYHA